MKFWLKECPKCGGDLALVQEVSQVYVECGQCGQCGLELNPMQERSLRHWGRVYAAPPAPPVAVSSEGRHQRIA